MPRSSLPLRKTAVRQLLATRHPVAERGPSKCLEKAMDTGLRRYDTEMCLLK
jgi:hypothetical protein